MAIMTVLLAEYSNEPIDVLKTVTMLLIHDLVEIELNLAAIANDARLLGGKERELVHHALGAQRLHDADARIEKDDGKEGEVFKRPCDDYKDCENEVDEIEEREKVVGNELSNRFCLELNIDINAALFDAFGHLGGGKAGKGPILWRAHGSSCSLFGFLSHGVSPQHVQHLTRAHTRAR